MNRTFSINRFCYRAALVLLIGILISGIPGNLFVNWLSNSPQGKDIHTYAEHFHPVQMIPLWGGFLMLAGFIALMAGVHQAYNGAKKVLTMLAFGSSLIYGALI